ncbi:hypothetical protein D3C77_613360 [compost metagenome]
MKVSVALVAQEVDAVVGADMPQKPVDIAEHRHAVGGDADVEVVYPGASLLAAPNLDAVLIHQLGVLVLGQVFGDARGELRAFLVFHCFLHACAALRGRMRHGGNFGWDGVSHGSPTDGAMRELYEPNRSQS